MNNTITQFKKVDKKTSDILFNYVFYGQNKEALLKQAEKFIWISNETKYNKHDLVNDFLNRI